MEHTAVYQNTVMLCVTLDIIVHNHGGRTGPSSAPTLDAPKNSNTLEVLRKDNTSSPAAFKRKFFSVTIPYGPNRDARFNPFVKFDSLAFIPILGLFIGPRVSVSFI